jgi:hypothetical protein
VVATPQLTVRFETDRDGNPIFVEDPQNKKHYYLEFEVKDVPSDVYAATFELHPTYYDPVRTLYPENRSVVLRTTSYGDYDLKVLLRTKEGRDVPVSANIVQALERARPSMPANTTIDTAIAELRDH